MDAAQGRVGRGCCGCKQHSGVVVGAFWAVLCPKVGKGWTASVWLTAGLDAVRPDLGEQGNTVGAPSTLGRPVPSLQVQRRCSPLLPPGYRQG